MKPDSAQGDALFEIFMDAGSNEMLSPLCPLGLNMTPTGSGRFMRQIETDHCPPAYNNETAGS